MRWRCHFFLSALLFCTVSSAVACPTIGIDEFVDFTCDQRFRVSFVGDSIVRGVGDRVNRNRGGYVKRLNELYGDNRETIRFFNLGIPGITTTRLLRELKENLNNSTAPIARRKTTDVDIVIIDVGRNDFFKEMPASFSVRNIRRIVKTLRREISKRGVTPFIVVSTLIPTNRGFQQPFVDEINRQLLQFQSKNLPTHLHMDRLPVRFISADNLHPSSRGFDRLTEIIFKFLTDRASKLMKAERKDKDKDNIFDRFEPGFGTSAKKQDTDGDSISDGDELFVLESNPLDPLDPQQDAP